MSKNRVIYTKRHVNCGVLSHFNVALLLLFRTVQVTGNLLCGSGIEDVVFQTGMMKNCCIKGVFSGSDYNRAWTVHIVVSEGPGHLLLTRFLTEVSGENIHWLIRNVVSEALGHLLLTRFLTEVSGENIHWFKKLRPSVVRYFQLD